MDKKNILAIEASSDTVSVALWRAGEIVVVDPPAQQTQSAAVLPWVRLLLKQSGIPLQHLDAIAYSKGPGSFTALRVGCGVAQGIGFALQRPLIGISTLAVLAAAVASAEKPHVFACLDARMDQLYAGYYVYEASQGVIPARDDGLYDLSELPPLIASSYLSIGHNTERYKAGLAERFGSALIVPRAPELSRASVLAQLGALRLASGESVAAESAGVVYLRDRVALTRVERAAR